MLHAAMPALRRASSKLESRSRWFTDAFGQEIFLATNAIVPVRGLRVCEVGARNFGCCGKVTKKGIECQRKRDINKNLICGGERSSILRDVLDQFSERFTDREKFSEIIRGEIGAGLGQPSALYG